MEFAKTKGMAVKLLHIIEEPGILEKIPFLRKGENLDEQEASTRDHLERIVLLEKATGGGEISYEIRRSKAGVAKEILTEDCDVIVMGRKRLDNDQVLLTGSTAEKVVRLSAIPVITIGKMPLGFKLNKIVFAGDFQDEAVKPILQRVIDLATIFQAELHFLHVLVNREFLNEKDSAERSEEIIEKFDLKGNDLDVYFAPTPEEGIADYISHNNPDLLALCTHGRTGIPHFFIGSVAENMADYAEIPVLTYNINTKKIDRSVKPLTRVKLPRSKTRFTEPINPIIPPKGRA